MGEGDGEMKIDIKLDKDFVQCFDDMVEKYGKEMQELNGLGESQLDYTDFIDNFIDKNCADVSIDANANVGQKDIVTLEREMSKPHSKLLAFNKIFYEMKKKYGLATAREWMETEWNGGYYLHDFFSATFKSYCFAYDLEPIATKGLFFIKNTNAQPPKHLTTFTDFVGETVSWTSNRTSGACGLPNFLIYSFYFWKKDVDSGYYLVSPEYYRDQEFQRIIYKLNQPFLRVDQSSFTNFSIFDTEYIYSLFGGKQFPDGTDIVDYADEILEYEKAFMVVCSKIRSESMMTFPVLTFSLLRKNGKFIDEDFAKWCCQHNMQWADSNFYISADVTSLSNCCRLVSNVQNLGYFNSIGGTALEVGSVKVNTLNLARMAYESGKDKEKLKEILRHRVFLCAQVLDRIRHIIERNIEKGLLPNYTCGLIHLESQYSTLGLASVFEMAAYMGWTHTNDEGLVNYTEEGLKNTAEILAIINEIKEEFRKKEGISYQLNVEQAPAERCAYILQEKDKLLYPDGIYNLPLYGNQWIPLGEKTSLYNKMHASSALDKACSGGSISHINIDAPFTDFDMAWDLLNKIADMNVPYFAFCTKISACEHNHGFYGEVCPICGGKKITTYQRVVGFLTPERNYSKERKAEFKMRDWFKLTGGEDTL